MATIKDIAKYSGVSNRTVSAVLNNRRGTVRVSQATQERVWEVARKLDYKPNVIAQGLRTGQSFLVGVIVGRITSSFVPEILQGIEDVLTSNNYSMILCTYHNEHELKTKISVLEQKKVDGILVFPAAKKQISPVCDSLIKTLPTVFIGSSQEQYDYPSVFTDGMKVGKLATEYLLSIGHREIAFLKGVFSENMEGYKTALEHVGVKFNNAFLVENCFDCTGGKAAFHKLKNSGRMPTAVVCYSDNVAAGFIAEAMENGMKVPEDISVVGVDDLPVAQMLFPPLTTIAQPKADQGSKATEMLIQMINGETLHKKDSVVFEPSLVIRRSCKKI